MKNNERKQGRGKKVFKEKEGNPGLQGETEKELDHKGAGIIEDQKRAEMICTWMDGTGPEADIVINSRMQLARNIKGIPFPCLATEEQREKVFSLLEKIFKEQQERFSAYSLINLSGLSPIKRQVLTEKQLISLLMVREPEYSALLLSPDEVMGILVNEEDHLLLQALLPGLQLEKAWEAVSCHDDYLEEVIDYAFCEELGYLTACPTKVGTGLRASALLHLPALVITGQINRILSAVGQVGLAVEGIYGEGSQMTGRLFQISNQVTLGQTEEEIWRNLYGVINKLINQERAAREQLLNAGREKLADRAGRAYGILKHARLLGFQEAMQLISDVRLGVEMGMVDNIPLKTLNELLVLIRSGCLQNLKEKTLSHYERDLERSVQIQKCLP